MNDLMSGVTSGAFDSSGFAQEKNMGGYMGMSTFDKLKMIAQTEWLTIDQND